MNDGTDAAKHCLECYPFEQRIKQDLRTITEQSSRIRDLEARCAEMQELLLEAKRIMQHYAVGLPEDWASPRIESKELIERIESALAAKGEGR